MFDETLKSFTDVVIRKERISGVGGVGVLMFNEGMGIFSGRKEEIKDVCAGGSNPLVYKVVVGGRVLVLA